MVVVKLYNVVPKVYFKIVHFMLISTFLKKSKKLKLKFKKSKQGRAKVMSYEM